MTDWVFLCKLLYSLQLYFYFFNPQQWL
uniref:Uncharacterized protein n=1 Tax=Anguilla anguilla TaxID=7936 RepID=A0A0E9UVX9_ANGAN